MPFYSLLDGIQPVSRFLPIRRHQGKADLRVVYRFFKRLKGQKARRLLLQFSQAQASPLTGGFENFDDGARHRLIVAQSF